MRHKHREEGEMDKITRLCNTIDEYDDDELFRIIDEGDLDELRYLRDLAVIAGNLARRCEP